jgi:predicted CXXCH cytochrome family protein
MKALRFGVLAAAAALLGACTDESVRYVNRPFNPPIDQVNGFLGYFDVSTKQTSCGNCHVGHQRQWATAAHADAWAGLQSSGGANASCEGCHTVSERGNAVEGAAGYDAVNDAAYHDVQCESCHGPGFAHASEPDIGPVPLSRLAARNDDTTGTCGECHSGAHHPFIEEWAQSRHAHQNTHATSASCVGCHEGRAVLRAWGKDANYIERSLPDDTLNGLGITCAVCHDPHGSPNSAQLRWPIETPDTSQNLCMKCHLRRTAPYSGSSRGNAPHAPQGAVLLGFAGYQNPTYLDTALINAAGFTTHGNTAVNTRLCAGCHVYSFSVTADPVQNATGHLFRPIPCYDANGVPTDTILNCAYTPTARSFNPCVGCHFTEDQAATLLSLSMSRLRSLTRTLWVDVDGDETVDAFPADSGILAKIKANTTDLNPSTAPVTAADGAHFNVNLVGENAAGVFMYANGDKSHGVHNPFLAEVLLRASIDELTDLYGAQPWFTPLPSAVQQILAGPLGVEGTKPYPRAATRLTGAASRR